MRFVQPDRILHWQRKPCRPETAQGSGYVVGGEEQIQVFGAAPDSGMHLQRESSRDHIGDATAI